MSRRGIEKREKERERIPDGSIFSKFRVSKSFLAANTETIREGKVKYRARNCAS